ncbi:hypothetical protein [Burkholderia sp. BCC1644]|uniref:hypothetical protein n=1 Tax=Burkholderia sp. BCC1644 TaxID=2676293 RepID=UPI001FC8D241|nr:hypothetical protein [Burkholderia sp. BCC1644]
MTDAPPRASGQVAGRAVAGFARIDWSALWLAPCADPGRAVQAAALAGDAALHKALNACCATVRMSPPNSRRAR